jgi:hypothetical protein
MTAAFGEESRCRWSILGAANSMESVGRMITEERL